MAKNKTSPARLTQVAFLRAINVGGHRVTNDELADIVRKVGFAAVVPYQASGNLLLSDSPVSVTGRHSVPGRVATEEAIAEALDAAFGYAVPTMIRTAEEVAAIATATLFTPEVLAETSGKIQVMFFKTELNEEQQKTVLGVVTPDDRIVVDGTEVYWLPTEGISTSTVKIDALNKAIGPLTIRTQGTISRIVKKLAG